MKSSAEKLFSLAEQARTAGRLDEAEQQLKAALAANPQSLEALKRLGELALERERGADAGALFQMAIQRAPKRADLRLGLAKALYQQGQLQAAANAAQAAAQLDARLMEPYRLLGDCLGASGDWRRAVSFYQQALKLKPGDVAANLGLGKALSRGGHFLRAVEPLEKALERSPSDSEILRYLGFCLYKGSRPEQAISVLEQLEQFPEHRQFAVLCLADIDVDFARPESALQRIKALADGANSSSTLLAVKGKALEMLGRTDDAVQALKEALGLNVGDAEAWFELARIAPGEIAPADLRQMEELAQNVDPARQALLWFAVAWVHESRDEPDLELEALHKGNAAKRKELPYDRDEAEKGHDWARAHFDSDFMARFAGQGNDELRPVFILGMPRSGTTLTEQILSSHPEVEATGENRAIAWALRELAKEQGAGDWRQVFESPPETAVADFARLFEDYLREFNQLEGRVFTDKNMAQPLFVPLLAAAFPRARFIQLSRHPMDTCFGCYRQLFKVEMNFVYSLEDCAFALAEFDRVMAHWRDAMGIPIHQLAYEDLVADQEGETRALLAHCGLEWDERCLAFHRNRRAVATASQSQVRQGMMKNRLGRWERFGSGLDPLREALERFGVTVVEH